MGVTTKGGIIVEDIKIGDIHYEFGYGYGIKVEVKTLPERNDDGYWSWISTNLTSGGEIVYGVAEGKEYLGPNLYNYEAHKVKAWL